nr:MAG TPA: hypothetical protein [Caudoviricetes sp.]
MNLLLSISERESIRPDIDVLVAGVTSNPRLNSIRPFH